jgi:hypothetical protein
MVQQEIGYNGFGKEIAPKSTANLKRGKPFQWNALTRDFKREPEPDPTLNRIFEIITSWNIQLLFGRGARALETTKAAAPTKEKNKNKPKRRKRRRFGYEGDSDDDDPWILREPEKGGNGS